MRLLMMSILISTTTTFGQLGSDYHQKDTPLGDKAFLGQLTHHPLSPLMDGKRVAEGEKGKASSSYSKKTESKTQQCTKFSSSPAPIPGPFSFYTTNEIFVEDVYPHVKLDMSYLNRPILKRASTAPMELVKGAHNKKLARNKTMLFNAKYQRPSSSNLPSQQDGQRTSNSRSALDPVPKSPSNIKDGLKKIMFDKRKANVMSQSKSEVAILETTRKKKI